MATIARAPSITFETLKVPKLHDILPIFEKSDVFRQLQFDHTLVVADITKDSLWQPLLDDIVTTVYDCLVTKKSMLASKQKVLTRRLEEVLVSFVDGNHGVFGSSSDIQLPGYMRGVIRLHATNFIRITKREMCHNITDGGTQVRAIVRYAFETDLNSLWGEDSMRQSGRESVYYITGWLLRAALKAAKRSETKVKEQLHVLVSNASNPKDIALANDNLPTVKVEQVEKFGGLIYANDNFFGFVLRLEYVFRKTLTPELLLMNGSCLIDKVYLNLNDDVNVVKTVSNFCEDDIDDEVVTTVVKYITRSYCRMRGKDFSRKIMSKDTNSLKQSRRPTLAAVSNPAIYKAKRKKKETVVTDASNEIEYLLFDAASGNISTEEKGTVDDNNLLQI